MAAFERLPGAELILTGLRDLDAGIASAPALLVSIGAPRLAQLGVPIARVEPNPCYCFNALLLQDGSDAAHGRYNALVRRLVSFERALACAR